MYQPEHPTYPPFRPEDNGRRVLVGDRYAGLLEFPLRDPGSAAPDEGIVWYDTPRPSPANPRATWAWEYVKPIDVRFC